MANLDISQAIKEKRLIDEAMKYDEATAKEFISRLEEVRTKFKDNEKLRRFYTLGICWLSMMFDFGISMLSLLHLFLKKYPHALYISVYRYALANPDNYRDFALARHDEVYDALVAMDLSFAAKILCESGFSEQNQTQLINALATNSKKEFLVCLSQCNPPRLFLQTFKEALISNESLNTVHSFIEYHTDADIPDDEFKYGMRVLSEECVKKISKDSYVVNEAINANISGLETFIDTISLLYKSDDEKAQAYILDIESADEYFKIFYQFFCNLALISRLLYPFLNEYERRSLDIMFRERKGCMTIKGKNETNTLTLRTVLDMLIEIIPYDKPYEKVNPTEETKEVETELHAHQSAQNGFAGYYLMRKPENLSFSTILSIAKDLSKQGTSGNIKQFINPEDVNTFCWFFNGGCSVKEIDFTRRIQWNSFAVSLKYLIALMYGASNPCQISQFKLQEGVAESVVNVFDYRMLRGTLKLDMKLRKQYFTKKVRLEDIEKEEKQILIDIVSKHVPWELNFK